MLRWTNTPQVTAGVVVVAPQDTDDAMGFDVTAGRLQWRSLSLPQGSPVGSCGGNVIWGGTKSGSVEPARGLVVWTYTPPNGVRMIGPPVVREGKIFVRTSGGLVVINPTNGAAAAAEAVIDFTDVVRSDEGRKTIERAGLTIENRP